MCAAHLMAMVSSLALAAPDLRLTYFSVPFVDGGWLGPEARFYCLSECDGVSGVLLEVRPEPGSYGGPGAFDAGLAEYEAVAFPYVHLARYAYRVSALFTDGGRDAPRPETLATADVAGGISGPGVPAVTVMGASIQLQWTPAVDDGGGVAYCTISNYLATGPPLSTEATKVTGATVSQASFTVGPGTWGFHVDCYDVVAQYVGDSVSPAVTTVAPGSVPKPLPPSSVRALWGDPDVKFELAGDGGDARHFQGLLDDGGVYAGPVGRLLPGEEANGYLPLECIHRVRTSVAVGSDVSDWSEWSDPFRVDLRPPTRPPALTASVDGGAVSLRWQPSTDSCSGVSDYQVHRGAGGVWQSLGQVDAMALSDSPGPGTWDYRVKAFDRAGHISDFTVLTGVEVHGAGPPDGGAADAGAPAPDGGASPADAGAAPDGGAPVAARTMTVGCGCGASGLELAAGLVLAALAWRSRGRHRNGPAK